MEVKIYYIVGISFHPIRRASWPIPQHFGHLGPSNNKGILAHPTTRASYPTLHRPLQQEHLCPSHNSGPPQQLGHLGPSYIDNWPCIKGINFVRADILLIFKCSNTPVIRLFSSDIPVIRLYDDLAHC